MFDARREQKCDETTNVYTLWRNGEGWKRYRGVGSRQMSIWLLPTWSVAQVSSSGKKLVPVEASGNRPRHKFSCGDAGQCVWRNSGEGISEYRNAPSRPSSLDLFTKLGGTSWNMQFVFVCSVVTTKALTSLSARKSTSLIGVERSQSWCSGSLRNPYRVPECSRETLLA